MRNSQNISSTNISIFKFSGENVCKFQFIYENFVVESYERIRFMYTWFFCLVCTCKAMSDFSFVSTSPCVPFFQRVQCSVTYCNHHCHSDEGKCTLWTLGILPFLLHTTQNENDAFDWIKIFLFERRQVITRVGKRQCRTSTHPNHSITHRQMKITFFFF